MDTRSPDASVIILFDDKGLMLVEHRSETRKRYPGCWALFGGRPEGNETPEETVRREAMEELQYVLSAPHYLYTQEIPGSGVKHVFIERFDNNQVIHLREEESQGYIWTTLEGWLNTENRIAHDEEPLRKAFEYISQNIDNK